MLASYLLSTLLFLMADYSAQSLNFSVPTSDESMAGAVPITTVKLEPEVGSPSRAEEMMTNSRRSRNKPRGRPPGSKNRPRPPIVITKECDSSMKSELIEISAGSDVVESLVHYARRRRVGLSVLSCCGSVSTVTLRRPMLQSLHGSFNLLSLSGSYFMEESESLSSCTSFGICLAGSQGQVFGGIVGGAVIAASLVVVVAATFNKPMFHRLPADTTHHLATTGSHDEQDALQLTNHESSSTPSCGFDGGSSPQPLNWLEVSQSHHDQQVLIPWGGAPSRPPLPPHY